MSACNMLLSVQLVADSGRPTLRSSGRGTQYCTTFGERSFGVSGPCLWNDLPNDLRNIGLPISTFGKHLKTQLFFASWRCGTFVTVWFLWTVCKCSYLLTYLLIIIASDCQTPSGPIPDEPGYGQDFKTDWKTPCMFYEASASMWSNVNSFYVISTY